MCVCDLLLLFIYSWWPFLSLFCEVAFCVDIYRILNLLCLIVFYCCIVHINMFVCVIYYYCSFTLLVVDDLGCF